jgi:hypothetical protein
MGRVDVFVALSRANEISQKTRKPGRLPPTGARLWPAFCQCIGNRGSHPALKKLVHKMIVGDAVSGGHYPDHKRSPRGQESENGSAETKGSHCGWCSEYKSDNAEPAVGA